MRAKKIPSVLYDQLLQRFLAHGLTGNGAQSIAMLSRTSGEGVTTTVCGFARRFVEREGGRVLVVDADASGRRVVELLGTGNTRAGRATDVSGLAAAVFATADPGVDVLKLDSAKLRRMDKSELDAIGAAFDCVIVDAGAWITGGALAAMALAESNVLILDGGRTSQDALAQFRVELEGTGQVLAGFVMNRREYAVPGFLYRLVS